MPNLRIPDTDVAAKKALEEYLAAEAVKPLTPKKEKFNKNEAVVRKQFTAEWLIQEATGHGLQVVERGRHMGVLDSQGHLLTEIPRHPGNLASGTGRSIYKCICTGKRG